MPSIICTVIWIAATGGGIGRSGDMIIRGGENVYPVAVENRLLEHARITDAVVIGVEP